MNTRKPLIALSVLFFLCVAITLAGTSCQGQKPDVPQGRFSITDTQYIKRDAVNGFTLIFLHDNETGADYIAVDRSNGFAITKLEK